MKIAETNKNFVSRFHYLWPPLVAILASYLGVDQYEKHAAESAPVEVEVNIETPQVQQPTASGHSHSSVTSNAEIQRLIKEAVLAHETSKQYHEF